MWSELSGLPISCATPAASKVSADKRSDSIVCWVGAAILGDVAQNHGVTDRFRHRFVRPIAC